MDSHLSKPSLSALQIAAGELLSMPTRPSSPRMRRDRDRPLNPFSQVMAPLLGVLSEKYSDRDIKEAALQEENERAAFFKALPTIDFPHKEILLNAEQLKRLPEEDKIDLLEFVLASDLPMKQRVLNNIYSGTPLTRTFLGLLEKHILTREIASKNEGGLAAPGERSSVLNLGDTDLEEYYLIDVARYIKGMPALSSRFSSRAINDETKSFLMATLCLLGGEVEGSNDAFDILASGSCLNGRLYSLFKEHIQTINKGRVGATVKREQSTAAADFILYLNPSEFEKLDDEGRDKISRMLLSPLDKKTSNTGKFARAKKALFENLPLHEELQRIHERMGPLFVAAALQNSELIQLSKEAETKWESSEWNRDPSHKKAFIKALYQTIGDVYSIKMPTINFYEKESQWDGSAAHWDGGSQSSKKIWDEAGKLTVMGTIKFNTLGPVGTNAEMLKFVDAATHEFCHLFEDVLIEKKKFGAKMAEDQKAFDHAFNRLWKGRYYYTNSGENFELYSANPIEKHARWFAECMTTYYRVFQAELWERESPGRFKEKALSLAGGIVNYASAVRQMGDDGLLEKKTDVDEVIKQGQRIKKECLEGSAFSSVQLEQLRSFLSESKTALDDISYADSEKVSKSAKIYLFELSIKISPLLKDDFLTKYINVKRYEESKETHPAPEPVFSGKIGNNSRPAPLAR